MEPVFFEKIPVVPDIARKALAVLLIPTLAFIGVCAALGWVSPWFFAVFAAVTAVTLGIGYLFYLETSVYEDAVVIKYWKTRRYRMEKIRDRRFGDINSIRNYAGIGIRGLRYRNYLCAGCETGVVFITHGSVVAVSSKRAEELANLLPKAEKKQPEEE
ncbi:MAG: hypothetical protein ACOX8L_03380 [Candidatus Methanomethylophilaceae archaeon]|jgi:hypothetical protein